jgi:hypothetical protein
VSQKAGGLKNRNILYTDWQIGCLESFVISTVYSDRGDNNEGVRSLHFGKKGKKSANTILSMDLNPQMNLTLPVILLITDIYSHPQFVSKL